MSRKQIFLRVIIFLVVAISIAAIVLCALTYKERPWLALFAGSCGAILDINIIAVWYLVKRNFRD
ncbi:MAG: hypothetical protein LBD28_05805 [Tannerellaceae bacterium]|jgi:NADH:ubiquinone oxidoreductase subunit 3 (subunit A)|nr:hypothetical protein [Tannerellaceae bacterium]